MQAFGFCRGAFGIGAVAVLLSACGGESSVPTATNNAIDATAAHQKHQIFSYTGGEQTFIVPSGVKRLTVVAHGGAGDGYISYGYTGLPGRVYAVIPVQPGDKLYIFVGGSGKDGGFNGGGAGGTTVYTYRNFNGPYGGGASDVRIGGDQLKDRIIVAAGGGGAGVSFSYAYAYGGAGGGLTGQAGGGDGYRDSGLGGGGGTKRSGGAGGAGGLGRTQSSGDGQPGGNGGLGLGGNGGNGGPGPGCGSYRFCFGLPGGGGGGGYYGGGGGGGSGAAGQNSSGYLGSQGGGGGGGSSYVERSAITSRMWTGWRSDGDGRVIILWK